MDMLLYENRKFERNGVDRGTVYVTEVKIADLVEIGGQSIQKYRIIGRVESVEPLSSNPVKDVAKIGSTIVLDDILATDVFNKENVLVQKNMHLA